MKITDIFNMRKFKLLTINFIFPFLLYKINLACLRHCVKLLRETYPHTIQLTLISDSTRKQ